MNELIARLPPSYFAFVMGTGIVAVGLADLGLDAASAGLTALAASGYVALWVLYVWRAIAHPRRVRADLRNPDVAFAYFTTVAGTNVLGVALTRHGMPGLALGLFVFATLLWFVLGYVLPWQVLVARPRGSILSRVNGSWFVWAVASQSLAVGMATVQPHLGDTGAVWSGALAVFSWSTGIVLYAGVAVLVLLRIIHYGITAREFEPPYWVAMGALAIAVVAGSEVVAMNASPMVDATRGLIGGTVVIFWSFCAWLVPLLVGAGVWRHVLHRVPLTYEAALWSMVFPVGMFAVASLSLGSADALPGAERIGEVGMVVAVVVWSAVFLGLVAHLFRGAVSLRGAVSGSKRGAILSKRDRRRDTLAS